MGRPLAPYDPALDPLAAPLSRYLTSGDESAIDEVVAATRDRLVSAARRIVSHDDAEDAVQTAYLSLVRRRGGALEAPVLPWLLTATIRTAYRRKALVRREATLAERLGRPAGTPPLDDAEDLSRLRREVARLPARYRDLVVLHDLAGLSSADVARLLDLPEATVRTRLHRARRLVRSRWSPVLAAGLWSIPWFLADRTRDAHAAHVFVGGAVNSNAIAGTVVLALAVGAGAGWLIGKPSVDAERRAERAESHARDLETRLAALEARASEAKGAGLEPGAPPPAVASATPSPSTPRPAPAHDVASTPAAAGGEAAAPARGARFVVPGREDALQDVDWAAVGANASAMAPLLGDFARSVERGDPLPADTLGRIQQHNGPLVTSALKYARATGRDLSDANTGFSEPAFMANAIAATLAAAKLPLTDAQASAIGALATRFADEDRQRTAGYGDRTYALERVIGDSESRDRFFQAAFAVLTPEQHTALSAPPFERRLQADIFSAALMWLAHAQLLAFADRDAFVRQAETSLHQLVDLPAAEKDLVHAAVVDYVNGFGRDVLETPLDALSVQGLLPLDRVQEAARRELALLQRLVDSGRFDDATTQKLRAVSIAVVPGKKPGATSPR